jgi:hypothetical protein
MAKSDEAKMETETIIRWDETGGDATLWTASIAVRREWESFGFPVSGDKTGWTCTIPVDRISYRTLKKG